jgi:hypothetical protein
MAPRLWLFPLDSFHFDYVYQNPASALRAATVKSRLRRHLRYEEGAEDILHYRL